LFGRYTNQQQPLLKQKSTFLILLNQLSKNFDLKNIHNQPSYLIKVFISAIEVPRIPIADFFMTLNKKYLLSVMSVMVSQNLKTLRIVVLQERKTFLSFKKRFILKVVGSRECATGRFTCQQVSSTSEEKFWCQTRQERLEHNSRKRDGVERIQNKLTGQDCKL
jgi:hypothetical protein